MTDDYSDVDDFDRLADSFLARLRGGELPSVSEYARRHPSLAEKIWELFPALIEVEGLKPGAGGPSGPLPGRGGLALDEHMPERLGDYRMLREIGSGGMGVVYEAERESLRAHVALKVLHASCRDEVAYRARFRNEARSAARLHHTNIVQVFDSGEHGGILFYAMQYIPGQGLDRVLRDVRRLRERGLAAPPGAEGAPLTLAEALHTGHYRDRSVTPDDSGMSPTRTITPHPAPPHPTRAEGLEACQRGFESRSQFDSLAGAKLPRYHREVARIGAEVADALGYAHGRGVLHRDIKPSNLLLDDRGTAWVTDFGLAKFEGSENLTEAGDVVGTLRYMAPERFEGGSDARCDIYALGVTMYEMLALRPAFEASDRARLVRRILQHELTPLRKLDPRISVDLSTVVHKAMARDPADRFDSAAEMAAELRRVITNQPIRSRRIPVHEQYWRWCRRNPLVASLNASIAIILTTASLLLMNANTHVKRQLTIAQAAEAEKSEQLWEAQLARARASRYMRRSGQRIDALATIAEAAKLGRALGHPPERFDRLRNEAIAALALPDIQVTREFGRLDDDVTFADIDDDFELYAVCDRQGRCIVRRVVDDVEVARLPQAESPRRIGFGPGRLLADMSGEGNRTLRVWDLAGPEPILRIDEPRTVWLWDFRPDGRRLVLVYPDNALAIHDLPTGLRRILPPAREILPQPELRQHPTAPYIAFSSYFAHAVQIRQLETGDILNVETPWPGGSCACEWSPDGRMLAVPSGDKSTIALYEFVASPPAIRLLRTIESAPWSSFLRFNAGGDLLFARGWGDYVSMFEVDSGRELFATRSVRSATPRIRADRGGRRLFLSTVTEPIRRLAYWSVADGRECRLLTPTTPRGEVSYVEVSPDSRLAVVSSGRWVTLYDIRAGREAGRIEIPGDPLALRASFDPDGRLLTNSDVGCHRWPVRADPSLQNRVIIGPPERLRLYPGQAVSTSRDGTVVAQAMYNGYRTARYAGGWILREGRSEPARNLAPGVSMGGVAVSPDGWWIAFSNADSGSVDLYDARTGRSVWELPRGVSAGFSPDGKWLATRADDGRLYAAGTWEPGPRLGSGEIRGFSPDGKTAILGTAESTARLVEVATGRELARFESPDPFREMFALTRDGAMIVESQKEGIRVWDLRRVRAGLAALGLDWDAPPLPPDGTPSGPLTVTMIGTEYLDPYSLASRTRRLLAPWLKGGLADARDYLDRADELACQGWHDPALREYEAIVRRTPEFIPARMHRGLELFRRGRWETAAADFAAVVAGDPSYEYRLEAWCRLAWSYHGLGRDADVMIELEKLLESLPQLGSRRACVLLLRAELHELAGRPDQAMADRIAAGAPDLALKANYRAWDWIMPGLELTPAENWRFVPAALILARNAVALAPDVPSYRNTLGMALLRSGKNLEARTVLEAGLALGRSERDAWVLLPLAMSQHRLGQFGPARESYDKAVAWIRGQGPSVIGDWRELVELQAEARKVLGL